MGKITIKNLLFMLRRIFIMLTTLVSAAIVTVVMNADSIELPKFVLKPGEIMVDKMTKVYDDYKNGKEAR
jgi:hypothetical protein